MSAAVEGSNTQIDPEAEVRKLQELVKKLEKQNQVLRSRQNQQINNRTQDTPVSKQTVNNSTLSTSSDANNYSQEQNNVSQCANKQCRDLNISLEDVELIDIEKSLTEEDEDKWLFDSPVKVEKENSVNPYKWARQELEFPSPDRDVESARRSLIYKLDEVAQGPSRSPSLGTLSSPGTQPSPADVTDKNKGGMPSIKKPLGTPLNTRTFTRKSKREVEPVQTTSSDGYSTGDTEDSLDGRQITLSRVAVVPAEPASDSTTDDNTETLKYNGVTDIKTLARMQEESLRQSRNSPSGSLRKSSLRGLRNNTVPSLGVYEAEYSPHNSARSSPARYDSDGYNGMGRSSNSLASASSHSSSPPDSPYGSQYLEPKQDNHRRSLPNLNKTTTLSFPKSQVSSEDTQSGPRTKMVRPRVHGSPVQRTASPGRTLSPLRSGIPTPQRSGIPRPGSASKLPTPRKSSIPTSYRGRRSDDDSWKDGCY